MDDPERFESVDDTRDIDDDSLRVSRVKMVKEELEKVCHDGHFTP